VKQNVLIYLARKLRTFSKAIVCSIMASLMLSARSLLPMRSMPPAGEVTVMLGAIDDARLEAWPVSDAPKSSKSKGEQLIEPIGPKI